MQLEKFSKSNMILFILCIFCIIQLINNRIQYDRISTHQKETERNIEDNIAYLTKLEVENAQLHLEIDKLKGKVEIIDEVTNGEAKRRVRINTAIKLIKDTLPPVNPLPGCQESPSPGEIWNIAGAIIDNSDEYGVPASLVAAVIRQESAYCNAAESYAGARGYMQLMPETATEIATDMALKNRRILSIWRGKDNIQMGTAYLSSMLQKFNGDIELAIKAYNAGPIHIKRVLAGERILYSETEEYAERVLGFKQEYERLGFQ